VHISDDHLDELVTTVLASAKYRHLSPELVRSVGTLELAKRRSIKEAVKGTKNKLHQVAGMYLPSTVNYASWLTQLTSAFQSTDTDTVSSACRQVMARHASTRERLSIIDEFYATTLRGLGPIHRILDIACGLNPLSLLWMPLAEGAIYYAYDIYADMVAFLASVFDLERIHGRSHVVGHAVVLDVIDATPSQPADVALILKALPCLEQIDKTAGARLLRSVRADHLLVSFPMHSLGGRGKGMMENYEARFRSLIEDTNWSIERFEFATELVFRVSK
jgi:16S rRNA (guanine(1405)-N(7))-methyltransferase